MNTENYIEHEVQLRLHSEMFKSHEKKFDKLDVKLNTIITMIAGGFLLPALIRYLGWL